MFLELHEHGPCRMLDPSCRFNVQQALHGLKQEFLTEKVCGVVEPFLRPARSKDMSAQSPSIRRVLPIAKPHRHEEETICIRKRSHCTSKPSSHQSCVNSPKLCWAMYFASHALQVLAKARRNVRNSSSLDNSNLFACVSNIFQWRLTSMWREETERPCSQVVLVPVSGRKNKASMVTLVTCKETLSPCWSWRQTRSHAEACRSKKRIEKDRKGRKHWKHCVNHRESSWIPHRTATCLNQLSLLCSMSGTAPERTCHVMSKYVEMMSTVQLIVFGYVCWMQNK